MQYTTNYNLKKPQYADEADIEIINDNTDDVDTLIHQNRTMIAPAFDNTKAYVTGDPVEYLGALYVFTADKAAGAWDASKVEPTTAAEMGGGGTSALADLDDVEITSPTQGQALLFDDDDDLWKNQTLPDASVTKEATGNPLELTDAASAPLVKCVSAITGSQDLHGYDKPWVGGAGKNKLDRDTNIDGYLIGSSGSVYSDASGTVSDFIIVTAGNTYTFSGVSGDATSMTRRIYGYNADDSANSNIASRTESVAVGGTYSQIFTIPNGSAVAKIRVSCNKEDTNLQIEQGSTVTTYEPYSNICPITAYTDGEIEVGGRNLYPIKIGDDYFSPNAGGSASNDNGTLVVTTTSTSYSGVYTALNSTFDNLTEELVGKFTYSFYAKSSVNLRAVLGITNYGRGEFNLTTTWQRISMTGTFPGIQLALLIYSRGTAGTIYIKDFMVERGDTAHDYEEYIAPTTHTTTFPSAIYRGSVDYVNGTATTEWGMIASYAGETLQGEWISDRDEYAPNTTPTTGAQVAYALATPTSSSVTVTNLPIKSLSGYNHIESTTGDMEIEYITKTYEPLVELIQSSDHVYSTQEQVVGTWIDGSTVYERTIDKSSSPVTVPALQWEVFDTLPEKVNVIDGFSFNYETVGSGIEYTTTPMIFNCDISGHLNVFNVRQNTGMTVMIVTIRYTKTSSNRSLSAPVTSQKSISEPLTDKTEEVPTEEEKTTEKPETEEETNEVER